MRLRSQTGLASVALVALWAGGAAARGQVLSSPQTFKPSAAVPLHDPASALPATADPASALPATAAIGSAQGTPATPAQRSSKRAEVAFVSGQLTIKADNSSLNLILREIGRQTGIKITGGVPEERVFGTYGPATPDAVLAKLLDGAGSNMLLIASEGTAPGELVLTPRMGGPTPPNPNAKGFDDDNGDEDAPRTPAPRGVSLFGGAQPTPPPETAPPQTNAFPPITQPSPETAPAAPANAQSPNGVKTPQEIYQQLQMLRQQQQQQQQAEPPDGPG